MLCKHVSSLPSKKDKVLLGKLLFVKLEVDDEAETASFKLRKTSPAVGESSSHFAYGPRSKGGREL